MTTLELEQVIREYMMDIYNMQYIGKISIKKLDLGYCIYLGMSNPACPTVIYAELEDDKFLKFLKEDLKSRNFHLSGYGLLKKDYPVECEPINSACCCNDKGRTNR